MTFLSYPYAWLPVVIVFGVPVAIAVPFFAYVALIVFLVVALVAVVAVGWGLVAAVRAVGSWLWWRRPHTAKRQGARRSDPLRRISEP